MKGDWEKLIKPYRPRKRRKFSERAALKQTDLVAFNSAAEQEFLHLARRLCPCSITTLLQESAFELNISVETAKRYLFKHSARAAELAVEGATVKFKQRNQKGGDQHGNPE